MRLATKRSCRSFSRGSGCLSHLPSSPCGVLGPTVAASPPPPYGLLAATATATPSPHIQHRPCLVKGLSNTVSTPSRTHPAEGFFSSSSSPCPPKDLNGLLLRRNFSIIQPSRLFHAAINDPPVSGENGNSFTRLFSRNVLWAVGFIAGMVLGAGFRLSSGFRLIPDEHEEDEGGRNTLLPTVKASKGFFGSFITEDEANNNKNNSSSSDEGSGGLVKGLLGGGGQGSGLPKHRARFNFIADVVERLAPSVVFIEILDLRRLDSAGQPVAINNGSGFVVDAAGYVLTNAHVVTNRPRASRIMVRLHDGRELAGALEEVDPYSDLALIKINANDLVPAPLGESSSIRPGEFVVAVGAPLSLSNTVTAGVVSSVSRCARDLGIRTNDINYIQTDAAITFGNSGGPLADLDGDVIGINSMKATAGISFAIPIDTAKEFLAKAAAKKKVLLKKRDNSPSPGHSPSRRAYLGITMLSLTKDIITELQSRAASPLPPDLVHGVLVWRVVIGSPAYHAGLQPGDVITQVNGHVIKAAADVYRLLEKPSDLTMVVLRGNNRYSVTVTPEE